MICGYKINIYIYIRIINHPWLGMVYITYIYGDDWGWFSIFTYFYIFLPTWWICWSPPRVILTDFWKSRCSFPWSVRWDFREIPIIRQGKTRFSSPLSARTSLPKLRLEVAGPFLAGDLQKCPWNPRFFTHVKTSYSWDLRWICGRSSPYFYVHFWGFGPYQNELCFLIA